MNFYVKVVLYILYFVTLYISSFFIISFLIEQERIKKDDKTKKLSSYPTVSIIVPAFNEGKRAVRTLRSIFGLDYPKEKVHIYVVDDGSTDNTLKLVRAEAKRSPMPIQVIAQPQNMGKAQALNTALKRISTEYFACLDADSEIEPDALLHTMSVFAQREKEGVAIVTPVMFIKEPKKLVEWMQRIEYATTMFLVRIVSYIDCNYVAPGPFSMYKTKVIKKFGGFSEQTITEDQDIAYNVQNHHYKLVQSPKTKVYTRAAPTLKGLYKQRNRWFKGSLQCIRKYRHVILNKEYGDFGLFQMPFNIFLFTLAVVSLGFFFYFLIKPLYEGITQLHQIGYDILPYLKDLRFTFDILALNWDSIIMSVLLISIAFVVLYVAHKEQRQSIWQYRLILLIPYFLFYYLFLSAVATISIVEFLLNKVQRW